MHTRICGLTRTPSLLSLSLYVYIYIYAYPSRRF